MITVVPKVCTSLGFATDPRNQYNGINNGMGSLVNSNTLWVSPMTMAGTVRNLLLYDCEGLPTPVDVTLLKNNVATALTTSLTAGAADRVAVDATNSAAFIAGDQLTYHLHNPTGIVFPGNHVGVCIDIEAAEQLFSINLIGGTFIVGDAAVGGALGNGAFEIWGGLPDEGSTYSICPMFCTLDRLAILRQASPSGGGWRLYVMVNGAFANGGTPDLDQADTDPAWKLGAVSIPLIPGDHVSIVVQRYGSTAVFASSQFSVATAVTPLTEGQYMLCGGSGSSIGNVGTVYKWTESGPTSTVIGSHTTVIGGSSIHLLGLYSERVAAPGSGRSFVYTALRNGLATTITETMANAQITASVVGLDEQYDAGDRITLQIQNVNTPASGGQYHWGLLVGAPPVECPGEVSEPRTDGLPYVPPSADPCAGTGERGAPRTGA